MMQIVIGPGCVVMLSLGSLPVFCSVCSPDGGLISRKGGVATGKEEGGMFWAAVVPGTGEGGFSRSRAACLAWVS